MTRWMALPLSILFVLLSCFPLFATEPRVVRVGAFNYFPGIFKDADGVIKGFYVDSLAVLGERENIRFKYVYGSWSEGLERIKSGEVDLLTSVAYTPERAALMDYAKERLLTVWGELYVPLSSKIDGIREVQSKKIAVMKGDINARHFINLVKKFDITCEFVEMEGFDSVFKAVAGKTVDAGVVNSTYGVAKQTEFGLRSTGIVFNPFDIYFTVAKGKNSELLALLDRYLSDWRHQVDSPYNQARQKWSHDNAGTVHVVPRWLINSALALGVGVLAAAVFIALLQRQVLQSTKAIRQQKEALRESNLRQESILAAITDIVMEVDNNKIYTWANHAGRDFFGDDVVGKEAVEYFSGEQNPYKDVEKLLSGDENIVHVESWQRRRDGEVRLLAWRCKLLTDADGIAVGVLSSARDITESKQQQDALQRQVISLTQPLNDPTGIQFSDLYNLEEIQRIQDAFAEATGVASLITLPDGTPITRPSNFCRLCKDIIRSTEKGLANCRHSDAVLGRFNPDGPNMLPCLSSGLWDAGSSISVDGKHVANWLIGQIRNDDLDEAGMLAYADEIGVDRELFREALAEVPVMSKEQFARVSQALYAFANELSLKAYQNLQQGRVIAERERIEKELKAKNAELEGFTYTVSHDLKSPLITIQAYTGMIIKELEPGGNHERAKADLLRVAGAATKMTTLLNDLLALSRVGKAMNAPAPIDMNRLVKDTLGQMAGLFGGQEIEVVFGENLPEICGDRRRLAEVVQNLIENAIKYMGAQAVPRIEIGVRAGDKESIFFVRDNGQGIAPRYHKTIFGLFNKLDTNSDGTGVGLALVKRIIEVHGGKVWVESEGEGMGSTFCFTVGQGGENHSERKRS